MRTGAAFLILCVAAALVLSVHSTCTSSVECPCGRSGLNITVCLAENSVSEDLCGKWAACQRCQEGVDGCAECPEGFEGPHCEKVAQQKMKQRRKRQYYTRNRQSMALQANRVNSADVFQNSPRRPGGSHRGICRDIDSPKLGIIRCFSDNMQRVCTGKCLPGYTFEDHDSDEEMVLQCRDGRWTPHTQFPPCKSGGHCDLVVQGAGHFNCTTGMRGTRCDVHCSHRYMGRYFCYPGQPWDPPLPYCMRSKGVQPPSEVRRPCRCEYGGSCDAYGRCVCPAGWTGNYCETSVSSTCNDPGTVPNGYRRNTDGTDSDRSRMFQEGESVVFSCKSEYALQGSSILTCSQDGTWSDPLPKCIKAVSQEITCPDPGQVANADRLNTDGTPSVSDQRFRVGQSVVYTCKEGFALQHQSLIQCLASGSWSSRLPSCRRLRTTTTTTSTTTARPVSRGVFCRDPGVDPNGSRSPVDPKSSAPTRQGFRPGNGLKYSCNQNYELNGERQIYCLTSGKWSARAPTCVEQSRTDEDDWVYCAHPGAVENGIFTYEPSIIHRRKVAAGDPEYPEGARLQYSCDSGYVLQGSSSLDCGWNGEWSSEPPTCSPGKSSETVHCENPAPIPNARIVIYPVLGSRTRRPSSPLTLEDPEYPEGTRLEFRCVDSFTLEGNQSVTCETSGLWSAQIPACGRAGTTSIRYCRNPGPLANGQVVHSPTLNERRRPGESVPEDKEFPEGSRLQYSCNDGYTLEGAQTLTCKSSGQWTASLPSCIAVSGRDVLYCANPGPILNGRIHAYPPGTLRRSGFDDAPEFPQGTRLEYSCEDGYTLQGTFALRCEENGMWSANAPFCSSECGRSLMTTTRRILHGTKTLAGEWPWVVALAVQEGSMTRIRCGAALLNRRTIVTAAHCLTLADSYTLYFGKLHFSDKNDDSNVMVRRSERVILHPNFTNATFDADIGLLRFAPPIRFSDRIQPICLPSPDTTAKNLMTGKKGYVTGWGMTERNLPSEELLMANLPVLTNEACMASYRRQNLQLPLTQNMFCAGFEDGQQSACRGDSGSPLVFYDRQADKHTLEGLVSFGVTGQCGLPGRYTVFTKVFNFVPWILRNL